LKNLLIWLLGFAGTALAALCFAALAAAGFHLSLAPPLSSVLGAFDAAASLVFSGDPALAKLVHLAGRKIGLELKLQPHWRYAFILLWLYFLSLSVLWWKAGGRGTTVFTVIWGFLVALLAGVAFGTLPIDPPRQDLLANALLAAIPLAAYLLFVFGISLWAASFLDREGASWFGSLLSWSRADLRLVAIASAVLLLAGFASTLPVAQSIANIGLTLAGIFVLFLSLYLIEVGVRDARLMRVDGESWTAAVLRTASPRIGLLIMLALGSALAMVEAAGGRAAPF